MTDVIAARRHELQAQILRLASALRGIHCEHHAQDYGLELEDPYVRVVIDNSRVAESSATLVCRHLSPLIAGLREYRGDLLEDLVTYLGLHLTQDQFMDLVRTFTPSEGEQE